MATTRKRICEKKPRASVKRQLTKQKLVDIFYTKDEVIDESVNQCIALYTQYFGTDIRSVIDFSAGSGYFCRALTERLGQSLIQVDQYDLIPRSASVVRSNWFDVTPRRVDLIGFNPPYGYQCVLVNQFLAHAARFKPNLMCCVHPFTRKAIFPPHYSIAHQTRIQADSFFNPDTYGDCVVPNCVVTYLVPAYYVLPMHIIQKQKRLNVGSVPGFVRMNRTTDGQNFRRGIAVRRTGNNSGRELILLFEATRGIFMDRYGKTHDVHGFHSPFRGKLSSHTFVTFSCAHTQLYADDDALFKLAEAVYKMMNQKMEIRPQGITCAMDIQFITEIFQESVQRQ